MADSWETRIRWIINRYCDGNQSEFGRRVEISQQAVSPLVAGKSVPATKTLEKIGEEWPTIRPAYLLTGEGPREYDPKDERRSELMTVADWLRRAANAIESHPVEDIRFVRREDLGVEGPS